MSTINVPAPHAVSVVQGNQTIVVDALRGQYYALNETGGAVWALLCDGATVEEVVEKIATGYDVAADQIVVDVERLVAHLMRVGLLSTVTP